MVLSSTKQSLENKEVSFLAIVEIIIAVSLYWSIAVYFNVYWHILASIAITPLLLLSSKQSEKLSLELFFEKIEENKEKFSTDYAKAGKSIVFLPLFNILMGIYIFQLPFSLQEIFFYSILFALTVSRFAIYSIYSRIVATIKNIKYGYRLINNNWIYNNFIVDLYVIPELLPGLESHTDTNQYKISAIIKDMKRSKFSDKIFIFIFLCLIYSFSFFYRLSIKSTFWFYIPLLLVVKSPNLNSSSEIGRFLSELYQTTWAQIRFYLAVGTLIAFFVTFFNFYEFNEVTKIPFMSVISMLYLDFSSVEVWRVFQLLVSVLTIGLLLYANAIRVPMVSNGIPLKKDSRVMTIYYANTIRNWISLFYFTSAFIFLAYYFKVWEYPCVPHFMEDFLSNLVQYIQYKPFG